MKIANLNVFSEEFPNGGQIPEKYSRQGQNVNPPLEIENLPLNTKSLVVIFENITNEEEEVTNWVQYNITAKNWINEDEKYGVLGLNTYNEQAYIGPELPYQNQRYLFRIYALDDFLEFDYTGISRREVEEGIRYHIIGYGKLEATYGLNFKFELDRILL